jgi:hypothetical protein
MILDLNFLIFFKKKKLKIYRIFFFNGLNFYFFKLFIKIV